MKYELKPSKYCVVCTYELTNKDIYILKESEFSQSWCQTCLAKHIESYPLNDLKKDASYELNRVLRLFKQPKKD